MRLPSARFTGTSWRSQLSHSISVPTSGRNETCCFMFCGSFAVLGGAAVEPFGAHAHPDSALLLGFSTPAPFTRNPITLTCYVDQPKGAVVVQAGSALDQVAPPAQFAYEFYDGSAWNTAGLQAALERNAVIDLKPTLANARRSIDKALSDFRQHNDDVKVDATMTGLRLVGIEFDSNIVRVTAEADGIARAALNKLPGK